jgi:hypothetical protein
MFTGPRRNADYCRCDGSRMAIGQENSVYSNNLRGPQQRAQVLWILKRIQHEQKWWFSALLCHRQNIKQIAIGIITDLESNTLVTLSKGI